MQIYNLRGCAMAGRHISVVSELFQISPAAGLSYLSSCKTDCHRVSFLSSNLAKFSIRWESVLELTLISSLSALVIQPRSSHFSNKLETDKEVHLSTRYFLRWTSAAYRLKLVGSETITKLTLNRLNLTRNQLTFTHDFVQTATRLHRQEMSGRHSVCLSLLMPATVDITLVGCGISPTEWIQRRSQPPSWAWSRQPQWHVAELWEWRS